MVQLLKFLGGNGLLAIGYLDILDTISIVFIRIIMMKRHIPLMPACRWRTPRTGAAIVPRGGVLHGPLRNENPPAEEGVLGAQSA